MSKHIVFMVNLPEEKKPGRTISYQYSEKSWKHYADKYGADLFVLRDRIHPESYMNANWHKTYAIRLLEANDIEYDKILIVDSDTIIHPDAPNIFELTGDKFYAVHNDGSYDWMFRSMENYSYHLFNNFTFPFTEYFNSGFLLFNGKHKDFFDRVIAFYDHTRDRLVEMQETYGVGTDQPVLNFMVQLSMPQDLVILPYEWNMQELLRREILDTDMVFTEYGWVYHYNGIPPAFKLDQSNPKTAVEQWMEFTYNKLYLS